MLLFYVVWERIQNEAKCSYVNSHCKSLTGISWKLNLIESNAQCNQSLWQHTRNGQKHALPIVPFDETISGCCIFIKNRFCRTTKFAYIAYSTRVVAKWNSNACCKNSFLPVCYFYLFRLNQQIWKRTAKTSPYFSSIE